MKPGLAGLLFTEEMSPSEVALVLQGGNPWHQGMSDAYSVGMAPGAMAAIQRPRRAAFPNDPMASRLGGILDSALMRLMLTPGLAASAIGKGIAPK